MSPAFDNLFNKVKTATKQAGEQAVVLAKIGKLKTNVMTLNTERTRHLQTIGLRAYTIYIENNNTIDGSLLRSRITDEIAQIERIDQRIREIESEIADLQASTQHVDVTDVTDAAENATKKKSS